MANKWTVKALELEEVLSKFHCAPYLMYWNSSQGNYCYRKTVDRPLHVWFLSFVMPVAGIILCSVSLIWKLAIYDDEQFPLVSLGSWFFFICLGCLGLGINVVMIEYSDDFTDCLNLLINYGRLIEIAEDHEHKPTNKLHALKARDIVGMFAIQNVCFLHVMAFLLQHVD